MIISGISIVQVLAILGQYISASYSRQFGISLQIRFYNGRVLTWSTKVSASTSAEHPWHMNAFLMNLELRKLLCITQLVLLLIQIEEFSLYYREFHAAFLFLLSVLRFFKGRSLYGTALSVTASGISLFLFMVTGTWGMVLNGLFLFTAGAFNCGPDSILGKSLELRSGHPDHRLESVYSTILYLKTMMVLSRSSVLILGQLIVLYTFRCSDCLTKTKNVFKSVQARYDFSDRNDNNTGFRPYLCFCFCSTSFVCIQSFE